MVFSHAGDEKMIKKRAKAMTRRLRFKLLTPLLILGSLGGCTSTDEEKLPLSEPEKRSHKKGFVGRSVKNLENAGEDFLSQSMRQTVNDLGSSGMKKISSLVKKKKKRT